MPDATYVQSSFAGGQWSEFASGRYHDPKYRTAMNACLNSIPLETENCVRRPGTLLAGIPRSGIQGRAIKFDFEEETPPYTMVLTNGYLQFWSGLSPVTANDSTAVTSISSANPAVMLLASAVTWATGDQGLFSGLSPNPLLENRLVSLTKVDTTHFSLTDAVTGANINGASLSAIGASAIFNRTLAITTPYTANNWSSIRAVQSDANGTPVSFLLENNVPPYAVTVNAEPLSGMFATFGFAQSFFEDGPYLDPIAGSNMTASALIGIVTLTLGFPAYSSSQAYSAGDFVVASSVGYKSLQDANVGNTPASSPTFWEVVGFGAPINNGSGFVASDVGRLVRIFSEPPVWAVGTTYAAGTVVSYNPSGLPGQTTYWQSLTSSNTGNAPGIDITNWQILEQGGTNSPALWTWGKVTALSSTGQISGATGTNIGTMTNNGGLAAAFDGVTSKAVASCATSPATGSCDIGKDYGGQTISQVVVYPSTDAGFTANFRGQTNLNVTLTINLRGSATAPSSPSNGTLLGTTGTITNGFASVTIQSNDILTSWNYVWIEMVIPNSQFGVMAGIVAQSIFYSASAAPGTAVKCEILGPALLYSGTTINTWRLGVYSGTTGYPSVGTWTDGRLWLSGSIPNRVDACVSNGIDVNSAGTTLNFAPTDQYGNVLDSSGISIVMNLPEANPIQWMVPDQQGVLIGTKAREALIFPPGQGGFTPTNIDVRQLTRIGSANIEPVRTEHTVCIVQKYLRKIVEYFADVFSGKFTAPNLIQNAKNLTSGGIQEIAYQQELAPLLWARVNNGLIGCTYKRDTLMTSSGPTMNGWHPHTLGSGRQVESICTGSSQSGNLDALTMMTNDTGTNVRFVEVLSDILDETAISSQAQYLDAAIVPSSTSAAAIVTHTPPQNGDTPYGGLVLNGLWPHNGKTVTAYLGGLDCGDYVVSNGSITVPYGDGIGGGGGSFPLPGANRNDQGLFTGSFVSTGITANGVTMFTGTMPMLVGFTFTSRGQLLRPFQPAETGARNGPAFAKLARDHYLMAQFAGSVGGAGGVQLGHSFTSITSPLEPANFTEDDDATPLNADQQFTGIYRDQFNGDYTFDSRPAWQVTRPVICNIQAIGAARETADI